MNGRESEPTHTHSYISYTEKSFNLHTVGTTARGLEETVHIWKGASKCPGKVKVAKAHTGKMRKTKQTMDTSCVSNPLPMFDVIEAAVLGLCAPFAGVVPRCSGTFLHQLTSRWLPISVPEGVAYLGRDEHKNEKES